jgi:hypothetical protein
LYFNQDASLAVCEGFVKRLLALVDVKFEEDDAVATFVYITPVIYYIYIYIYTYINIYIYREIHTNNS